MKKFTVIGYYEETGEIFSHHVEAKNSQYAFFVTAEEHESAQFIVALEGHQMEGRHVEFPGAGVVDAETVLDQPEVFDSDEEEVDSDTTVLADCNIKDWRDPEENVDLPEEHKDTFNLVIEQSPQSKQFTSVCIHAA